jgi:hypothetical protein
LVAAYGATSKKKKGEVEFDKTSVHALGRIDHSTEEERTALTALLHQLLSSGNDAKWPQALQYFENTSYLLGNHFTRYFYDPSHGFGVHQFGLDSTSRFDTLIAKVADNRLIRPVETVVVMLTDHRPQPRVDRNSDKPEDEDAAALGEVVINLHFERPLDMPNLLRDAVMIALTCGSVIAETEYGDTGEPTEIPKYKTVSKKNVFYDADDPESGPEKIEVQEEDGFETVSRRDAKCSLWTPMHVTVDPTATSFRDMGWIARTSFEDIDWIRENYAGDEDEGYYPEAIETLGPGDCSRSVLYWWTKFQDVLETPHQFGMGGMAPNALLRANGMAPGQTTFTVVDVRPSRQFPRGRTLVLAGGKLIYCSPKEVGARAWSEKYHWRWHPYSYFGWFKVPGRFWSVAMLTQLVPLQKKINAIDALVHANRQYMSIGQWLLPRHAKLAEGRISGLP